MILARDFPPSLMKVMLRNELGLAWCFFFLSAPKYMGASIILYHGTICSYLGSTILQPNRMYTIIPLLPQWVLPLATPVQVHQGSESLIDCSQQEGYAEWLKNPQIGPSDRLFGELLPCPASLCPQAHSSCPPFLNLQVPQFCLDHGLSLLRVCLCPLLEVG